MSYPLISFWSHWGDELASLATVFAAVVTAASAVIAALALRRMRQIQFERNTFEFILTFSKDAVFREGMRLLKEQHDQPSLPAYYSLPEEQRLPITAVMNAYDSAGELIDRGFIDESVFLSSYTWFVQTHWHWTKGYVEQIRQHSVGGRKAFAAFENLKDRAAARDPHIAKGLSSIK